MATMVTLQTLHPLMASIMVTLPMGARILSFMLLILIIEVTGGRSNSGTISY
jgi:hypothetical protein